MEVKQQVFTFESSSKAGTIHGESFVPSGKIKAVVQISHGMAEHGRRYRPFIDFLNENQMAVYLIDHLGHGLSAKTEADLGYFKEQGSAAFLVRDQKTVTEKVKQELPGIPVILFGHSMGSFIARAYTAKYANELAGAVFCGTSGGNPLAGAGKVAAQVMGRFKGRSHRSRLLDRLVFGGFNKKIPQPASSFAWLAADGDVVRDFEADPLSGYLFTVSGFETLSDLLISVSKTSWYQQVPSELPILLMAGMDDPLGDYGKGIEKVARSLKQAGHDRVRTILYPQARHEILNEVIKDQVFQDFADWAEALL